MSWDWDQDLCKWDLDWVPYSGPTVAHARQLVDFYLDEGLISGLPRTYKLTLLGAGVYNNIFKLDFSTTTSDTTFETTSEETRSAGKDECLARGTPSKETMGCPTA